MRTQMKVNRIASFLIFVLLKSFYLVLSASSLDCDRLYFGHPSEKTFPYIHLVNKVYVKTGEVKDNYPVYKDERGDIYFSYSKHDDKFYFTEDSKETKDFAGSEVKSNQSSNNKKVAMIFYYTVGDSVNITAKCVSYINCAEDNTHPYCDVSGDTKSNKSKKEKNLDDNKGSSIALKFFVVFIPVLFFPMVHFVLHYCAARRCLLFNRTLSKHAYAGIFVWLIYIIVYQESSIAKYGPETFEFIYYVAVLFIVMGYIFVLFESICCSKEMENLSSIEEGSGETYINGFLEKPPVVTLHMTCYHTKTTEFSQLEVPSWTGKELFNFNFWADRSDTAYIPRDVSVSSILEINFETQIKFADEITPQECIQQKKTFARNNQHRDLYHRETVTKEIPELKKHIILYNNERGIPSWIKRRAFALYTMALCSWPYRLLLKRNTLKKDFVIIKLISNYEFDTSQLTNSHESAVILNQDADEGEVRVTTDDVEMNTNEVVVDADVSPPPYEVAINIGKLPTYEETCI